jgi:putative tryptophan/tyrosine transport system permease protein
MSLLISIMTSTLPFLPFAFAVAISLNLLRATDMTLDGSFVLGAGVFARLVTMGVSPILAGCASLIAGFFAGMMVASIQRGGRVDPLLAGILATFILASVSLILMGRPNISLLSATTLVSFAFAEGDIYGWLLIGLYSVVMCLFVVYVLKTTLGLRLRALGDNPYLLTRLSYSLENYRLLGFALTNGLAAFSGLLMAQSIGFADIGMGFGMTLTGIGAVILGRQLLYFFLKMSMLRITGEFFIALIGVVFYFSVMVLLLRFDIDPVYLKMCLGLMLVFFLRAAFLTQSKRVASI